MWGRYGDLEAVEDFIAVGKDVSESDEEGRTPLHYAVAYNHAEIVDELVSSGANLEAQVHPPTLLQQYHMLPLQSPASTRVQHVL